MASRLPKTAPKLERKYVEKNRRNHLKTLYKHLFSLLPPHLPQEGMALHDQVDETVKYIRWLQSEVEKSKQKKEELQKKKMVMSSSRKRPHSSSSSSCDDHKSSPLIQVLDIGPGIHVVLINDLEGVAAFHNIIRILHQHGLEVANATFQQHGNSMLQVVHQQAAGLFGGSTMLSEKLKQVLYGSSSSCGEETEQRSPDSWDYDIWGFHSLEPFQELHYPPPH